MCKTNYLGVIGLEAAREPAVQGLELVAVKAFFVGSCHNFMGTKVAAQDLLSPGKGTQYQVQAKMVHEGTEMSAGETQRAVSCATFFRYLNTASSLSHKATMVVKRVHMQNKTLLFHCRRVPRAKRGNWTKPLLKRSHS
eukprot:145175-Amphidinium_carterae.1